MIRKIYSSIGLGTSWFNLSKSQVFEGKDGTFLYYTPKDTWIEQDGNKYYERNKNAVLNWFFSRYDIEKTEDETILKLLDETEG